MNDFNTLKEFYEKDAARFSSFQKTGIHGRDAIIAKIIPICKDNKSSIFLEYGFGNGNLLCHFAGFYEKAIGYEISISLIKGTKKNYC